MGEAIGEMLPVAIAVAISSLPVSAVVLTLVTARGNATGLAFVLGWILGLGLVGAIVLAGATEAGASDGGEPAAWVSLLNLVLGLLALALGVKAFRGRPRGGERPPPPTWMRALHRFTPAKAAGTALLIAGVSPKNMLLAVAGAAAIAETGIEAGGQAVAYALFVVVASIGVAVPVVVAVAMGPRARELLEPLELWLAGNNATIMAVLFVVIGSTLIGDAISGA
jgi:hypothetical protein